MALEVAHPQAATVALARATQALEVAAFARPSQAQAVPDGPSCPKQVPTGAKAAKVLHPPACSWQQMDWPIGSAVPRHAVVVAGPVLVLPVAAQPDHCGCCQLRAAFDCRLHQ